MSDKGLRQHIQILKTQQLENEKHSLKSDKRPKQMPHKEGLLVANNHMTWKNFRLEQQWGTTTLVRILKSKIPTTPNVDKVIEK